MDGKIKDMFEKITRYIRPPFRSNDITDEVLQQTGGRGLYAKHEIDLSIANSDMDIPISGDNLTVEDCPDAVTVKLNHKKNPEIDLQKIPEIEGPFKHLFINNAAGSGTLKFFTGDKGMFRAKKKLDFMNLPTYIIKPSGSYFHAYNDSGNRIKADTDFADLMNSLILLGGDNTYIFIKPPSSSVLSVTDTIEIPNGTTGVTIEGGGFRWYDSGVVLVATDAAADPIMEDKNTSGQPFTRFLHLSFDGDEGGAMTGITGLKAHGQDSKIEGCSFYDCGDMGLSVKTNAWVEKCWIEKCNHGIRLNTLNEYINNNLFWDNTNDIDGYSAGARHFIRGNRSSGSDDFFHARYVSGSMDDLIITENIFYDIQNYVFHFEKTAFDKVLIANNICDGNSATDYFIYRNTGTGTITNSQFQNNTILNMAIGVINSLTGWTKYSGNIGYVTENGGTSGNVADGGTIAHGCITTPTHVSVVGTVSGEFIQVTGLDGTNITVAIKTHAGAAGTAQPIYWRAWV